MLKLIEASAIGGILGFLGLGSVLCLLALAAGAVIGVRPNLKENYAGRARWWRRRCGLGFWVLGVPPAKPDQLWKCYRWCGHRGPHAASFRPGAEVLSAPNGLGAGDDRGTAGGG